MSTKIVPAVALLATLVLGACQAQQSAKNTNAAVVPIVPAAPAAAGFTPYNDDLAAATLRWLRDQDSAYLSLFAETTSDEGRRIIDVQRLALREQARAIIDGHAGTLPADLASYFPKR